MRLDLRYPFLTSGIPKRNTRRRDLYTAISMVVEVPEISRKETDVAFRTYQRCALHYRYGHGEFVNQTYEVGSWPGGVDLRTYNGKLYRRIGTEREILEDTRTCFKLGRAFPHVIGENDLEYGADISMVTKGTSNPLSAALVRQWDWELERASVSDGRVVNAWPMAMAGKTRHDTREATDFRDVVSEIAEVDVRVSERSLRMIEQQTGRLLAIDGEIWMTCRPPCLVVSIEERGDIFGTLSLAHAHDGLDTKLSRRYFALTDLEPAREYLQECARKPKRERGEYQCYEALPQYDVIAPEFTEYDADGEELSRIGYTLASECSRYAARTSKRLDGSKQDNLDAAMQAVGETNYVTGEFGDVTPFVEDVCVIWNDFGRPSTFCEVGPAPARKRFGDMMIKRAGKLIENAPIDFGSGQTFAFGGSPRL
ncbi:hypothetical protein GOB57_08170 [Sinorhizobium meliloti]|nr:hypothetical protein [Sinorhizobium meliloti]